MKLSIKFPENLLTHSLLEQRLIPCICKIATEFEIEFLDPLPEAAGTVLEWDRAELEKRAIGGVGGQYSHYAHGRVTLKKVDIDIYQILDFEMFYRLFGWCSILEDGNYAPPGQFWDDE